ncbi:MAG: hypothetical protein KGM17_03050 [Sphingomonadales bacterium]|nr:hypothetical protein [Sphingomonadales bacterium]
MADPRSTAPETAAHHRREARVETRTVPSPVTQAIREGEIRVRPLGLPRGVAEDVYHRAMRARWRTLGALFGVGFLAFNLLFAALYRIDQQGLSNPPEGGGIWPFWRDFFFSVHTVATIGYGNVYPVSVYANIVVVVEITLGLVMFALATGIAFARFSRPTARIAFSRVAVVREVDGVPTLMLRAANQRHNMVYAAEARLSLLIDAEIGGTPMRRFADLRLVRSSNPTFTLTWTIMHPIDADSPLHGWLEAGGPLGGEELLVLVSGHDEASGQTIHGRWVYVADDVRWGARFVDIVATDQDGTRTIDYRRFHDVETRQPLGEE